MNHLKPLAEHLKGELTEGFLLLLLRAMDIALFLDSAFRRNVEGFSGRYQFRSRDGEVQVAARFDNGHLHASEGTLEQPDVTLTFRDEKAIRNFLLTPNPDILGSVLRQDVVVTGNLNHLYKFAFMGRHLVLAATGKL